MKSVDPSQLMADSESQHQQQSEAFVGEFRYLVESIAAKVAGAKNLPLGIEYGQGQGLESTIIALNGVQTNTLREIGNISSQLQGSIASNRSFVDLVSYQLQYSINSGGSWVNIGSAVGISGLNANIPATTHNDIALINSTSIWYRTVVVDTYQQFISSGVGSSAYQITLRFLSYLGFSTSLVIDNALILGLANPALVASRVRSVSGVTATLTEYTYIAYPSSYGNLTSVRQNPLQENLEVIGAFTLQYSQASPFSVTNQYGIVSNYIVYNTAASGTQSFVNATLALS